MNSQGGVKGAILFSAIIISTILHFIYKRRRFKQLAKEVSAGQLLNNKFYAEDYYITRYFEVPPPKPSRKKLAITFLALAIIGYLALYIGTKSIVIIYTLTIPLCLVISSVVFIIKYEPLYYERLQKIRRLAERNDKLIEVRNSGLYFNLVFIEPYSYKKALENAEANIFIPWDDIKSISESSPPAFGGRPGRGMGYGETIRKCLFIKLKPEQPSAKKLGKQIFISLNMVKDYLDMEFLIQSLAGNHTKCRL